MLLQALQFLDEPVEDALLVLTVGLKFSPESLDLANDPVDLVISTLRWWTVRSVRISSFVVRWTRRDGPTEEILFNVDDFDLVMDVLERDRVVRPDDLVEVDRAFVVSMDELARTSERIDLHRIGLVGDLLDDESDVVSLDLVGRGMVSREWSDLGPNLRLAWWVFWRTRIVGQDNE